jgi:hypothetical protein
MKRIFALAVLLTASGYAAAFDFKGIELGGPASIEQVERLGVKCGKGSNNRQICNGYTTVAGKGGAYCNLVIDEQGVVQRISLSFPESGFAVAEEGLIEKFGKPSATREEKLQNRMGATFNQRVQIWTDKAGNTVMLSRYGAKVDESTLYFGTPADAQLLKSLNGDKKDL